MNSAIQTRSDVASGRVARRKIRLLKGGIMRGIAAREVRAAAPAITAILAAQLLWLLAVTIQCAIRGWSPLHSDGIFSPLSWSLFAGLVALVLGALCGAEEEENRTADFARRLPIPPWRVLFGKTAGSLAAYVLWAIGSMSLTILGGLVLGMSLPTSVAWFFTAQSQAASRYVVLLSWAPLLAACGFAAGTLLGHVIPALVIAGMGTYLYYFALILPLLRHHPLANLPVDYIDYTMTTVPMFWTAAVIATLVGAARFVTREGT